MMTDNALANFRISYEMREGGDSGRRRVEHRGFLWTKFGSCIRNRSEGVV